MGHAIAIFTADDASANIIASLSHLHIQFIAIRAAGYDNVDLAAAEQFGIRVANVPEYSPYAIAEHAMAMILAMNRQLLLAHQQVSKQNFTIENLIGFDLHGKKAGIIGTGRIGAVMAKILHGFGCEILAYDLHRNIRLENDYQVTYTGLETLCSKCDIISLHTPLNKSTQHLINEAMLEKMKPGVMIVNTARGAIIDTSSLLKYLENGRIGYLGMDVYEFEKGIFLLDHSGERIADSLLTKLISLPNVMVTPHQAFATHEALTNIAETTFFNLHCWATQRFSRYEIGTNPINVHSPAIVKE